MTNVLFANAQSAYTPTPENLAAEKNSRIINSACSFIGVLQVCWDMASG